MKKSVNKFACTLVFVIILMSVFIELPLAQEEDVRSRLFIAGNEVESERSLHTAVTLESRSFTSISAKIRTYWNDIDSFDYYDFVASAIGVARYSPIVGWEWLEVGSIQDNKGLHLYIGKLSAIQYSEKLYPVGAGEVYSLKIESITDRYWVASVGEHVDSMYFFEDIEPERYAVAQAESGDPTNPLRGYIFDIQYDGKLWDTISVYEDRPYQAIIGSLFSTIQGDATCDYSVGMSDAGEISSHWHQKKDGDYMDGPEGYDKSVDLTHDGQINFDDVGRVQAYWQWNW